MVFLLLPCFLSCSRGTPISPCHQMGAMETATGASGLSMMVQETGSSAAVILLKGYTFPSHFHSGCMPVAR